MTGKHEQIDTLERRLQDGFKKIGEAMNHGIEVDNWERHWIELLREYERLNDELAATPHTQAPMPGLPRREAA
jgi:hypothetical protein